nr:hypothetical protein [Pseudomonadota bacterium]
AKSSAWQEFSLARRSLLSSQSAGLSTLYYLAAQRTPKDPSDPNSPSPESIASAIANWRTAPAPQGTPPDQTWYMQMQTALPAAVARETLFVLAEMQRELHQMRLENQRMMALQAVQGLGMLTAGKTILGMKQSAVQSAVSVMLAPAPSGSNAPSSSSSSDAAGAAASMAGTFDPKTGKYTPSAAGAAAAAGANKYTAPGTSP